MAGATSVKAGSAADSLVDDSEPFFDQVLDGLQCLSIFDL